MNPVLPLPDPTGLPAPVWLLATLLVLTFILHLLPMNLILGGGFVTAWAVLRGRRLGARGDAEGRARHEALAARIARLMPVATAFTITLGIAPLLFVQVLYGQLFYTSSVLMAWVWLAVIGLLMIGYYGTYGVAMSKDLLTVKNAVLSFGSSLVFLVIGFIMTHNFTLMLRPERWDAMYRANDHGTHWNFADPTVWPRYAHYVVASFAFTGLVLALIGALTGKNRRAESAGWMKDLGSTLFIGGTLVQMATGLWFLFALEPRVRDAFLGGSLVDTALLWGGVAAAVVAMLAVRKSPVLATVATALTLVGMAIARQRERTLTLQPYFRTESLEVAPQTVLFLIFAALLVAGLALVGWMLWKFFTAPVRKVPGTVETEARPRRVA